jgi:hypothetical protein
LADRGSDNAKDGDPPVRYDSKMPNDPLSDAIDTELQELRAAHERASQTLREGLVRAAASARDSALSDARAQAEAFAAERIEAALAKARVESADALTRARTESAEALTRARAEGAQALAAAEAAAAESLRKAIADVRRDAEDARIAAEIAAAGQLEKAVDQARVAAEAAAAARLADAMAAARAETERALAAVRDQQVRSNQGGAARLLKAIRDVDRAGSLSEVLDALVDHAGRQTSRVAVLLVQGDHLRGWRFAGFNDLGSDPRSLQVPLSDPAAGVLAAALRKRAPSSTGEGPGGAAPSFAGLQAGRTGLAVPIEVGGRIVAIMYADEAGEAGQASPEWQDALEVLARHAGRCLEALTAVRMRGAPASQPDAPAPDSAPAGAAPTGDGDAARRYAKLLISEIRLYHESAVTAGRRERNLLERLGGEIERARGLYNARIPAAARADYFNQELIRTLADGDPSLLGHPV